MEMNVFSEKLSDRDFEKLSAFIYDTCGIKMPPSKKLMLEGRLRKRLRVLELNSFSEYVEHIFGNAGRDEIGHMIDVVTTNKTDFFREPAHFDYLTGNVLPELAQKYGVGYRQPFTMWSAGCSSGEEPYTMAMVLKNYAEMNASFSFSILGTDISTIVLSKAKDAVYDIEKVSTVPQHMLKKYVLRGKGEKSHLVRMSPELRNSVQFGRLNFMDDDFGLRQQFDVIFCRNVIIYFDRPTQERLVWKFHRHMRPGGYLFMGHSETLHGLNVPLVSVAPTIYKKPE